MVEVESDNFELDLSDQRGLGRGRVRRASISPMAERLDLEPKSDQIGAGWCQCFRFPWQASTMTLLTLTFFD